MLDKKLMDLNEFKEYTVHNIRRYLPESLWDAKISVTLVNKNNGKRLHGLNISSDWQSVTPVLYLEYYYEEYLRGINLDDVLMNMVADRVMHDVSYFDASQVLNIERCKSLIVPKLVNASANRKQLETRPHRLVTDLAIIYCIRLDRGITDGVASIDITEQMMSMWEISEDELHDIAIENMKRTQPSTITSMMDVLMGLSGKELENLDLDTMDNDMYVLRTKDGFFGAAVLLDQEFMEEICDKLGKVYVLPSSVHEVIIIPWNPDIYPLDLADMILEVNESQVEVTDQLSDHAYIYTIENGLQIAI